MAITEGGSSASIEGQISIAECLRILCKGMVNNSNMQNYCRKNADVSMIIRSDDGSRLYVPPLTE